MKTKVLFLLVTLMALSLPAQTTHHLDWEMGTNGPEMDLTIDMGDTVIWTWTDNFLHSVENYPGGSSVETFDSGNHSGLGYTFSHTFTVEGSNDYYCGVHGTSMSGTITVEQGLSVDENETKLFTMVSNPVAATLTIDLPQHVNMGQLVIHDMLGKQIILQDFNETQQLNINVSSLKQGLYLVSIESENKKQSKRFIKN